MTKAEIIAEMADQAKITKAAAERALDAFVDSAKKTLRKDGRFAVSGLGSFVVTERKARMGRNPQTGAPISIPASKGVRFKAGKSLKDAM